jgi:squalene-hopene/tetraprenyl-beta-curcumene cyclase
MPYNDGRMAATNGGRCWLSSSAERLRDFDMRWVGIIVAIVISGVVSAQGRSQEPPDGTTAIRRGLAFLVKDALAWKEKHNCISCHHGALVVCAMREAKQRSHAINDKVLAELTTWIAESGDGKFGLKRPESAPHAASPKAIYFALALGIDAKPDAASQKGLKLLLSTVEAEQTENGSWSAWPQTRPPMFGSSDESLTALATLAVLPAAAAGDAAAKATRDKAVRWLQEMKSDDDPQSIALRLVLWSRLGRPAEECEALARRIRERQNADGGWNQTKGMDSDAWATGQALYALAQAGTKASEQAIIHGRAFLIKTQREDGSWPMTSRPTTPGGKGSTSLIPITGAGSSWAVLGLVRSQ